MASDSAVDETSGKFISKWIIQRLNSTDDTLNGGECSPGLANLDSSFGDEFVTLNYKKKSAGSDIIFEETSDSHEQSDHGVMPVYIIIQLIHVI